jgi:acetoin utilization protein AcuB
MLVKDRMTRNPVTITPDTPFPEALRIIHESRFRHLPVVDEEGKAVGIVTEADLLRASPSSATSLSIYEVNYLLANLRIREVMSSPPITVPEDSPLEEAARTMVENSIGCLLVMHEDPSTVSEAASGQALVGVITETDIFKGFVEILGGRGASLRITLQVPDVPGELARLATVIADLGGNLCSVAAFRSEDPERVYLTFRLKDLDEDVLLSALEEMGEEVVHVCRVEKGSEMQDARSGTRHA